VVTRAQLLRAGITAREIQRRLEAEALLPVHRGVYRVGHQAPSVEARYMAAVLACGDGSLLCGRAAAYLLEVVKGRPPAPEVTAPTKRRVKGVKTHRADVEDRTRWRGIPVTTVPRTLVDLAPYLPEEDLARVCHEAGVRHHTTPAKVEAVLARRPKSPGAGKLRAVLRGEVHVSLSKLERRFLYLLRKDGLLLPPQTNRPAGTKRVDCRWPEKRLTVELDSYRYHGSRYAWEQDRRREREAHARGDEFRRYTWGDVFEGPTAMLAELRMLLPTTR
jgi:very-short-patch-repair endonuclease